MFTPRAVYAVLLVFVLSMLSGGALADDWIAVKLRGSVFTDVAGDWVQLRRGDVVPDERTVRTLASGHVMFQRDAETIDVGPNSQIEIVDRTGKRYTTVKQYYGKVEVEANIENVQHFAVRTPYLAAVVKGTNFTVASDDHHSLVAVRRGHVAVEDLATHQKVLVSAGQTAATVPQDAMVVTGRPDVVGFRQGTAPASTTSPAPRTGSDTTHGTAGGANAGGSALSAGGSVGGAGVGVSAGASSGGLGVSVGVDGPGGADLGASVSTGGLFGGGSGPLSVSVETPLGGISLGLGL